jgi:hypothetical protein
MGNTPESDIWEAMLVEWSTLNEHADSSSLYLVEDHVMVWLLRAVG